jgi:hypothetical protein
LRRLYLACPRCDRSAAYPLDDRLGVAGFLSPQAQRLLCLAGASWSFDRAAANLKEFCGLTACDNVIREACRRHGGALRRWQREDPAASAAFRAAGGDVEFQTDGTMVNSYAGWREMRLSIFAKRRRGKAVTGRDDWQQRKLPAPHVRVIEAGVRSGEQLGPAWRRMAGRLGLRRAADVTAIADGARWIWRQLDKYLPGAAGVLDIYHASEQLWSAARQQLGEASAEARAWVEGRRATLLREGVSGLLGELSGAAWSGVRGYFEPHGDHSDYAGRLASGQSIGSGLVGGACKQVIGRRLKQTGARWKVRRVERMATLCAVQASGQWDAYWSKVAERST